MLVGCDPASQIYVQSKVRMAERLGLRGEVARLPDDASEADLLARVETLNARDDIDGILVQLPLPAHIDALRVMAAVDPAKDVDGLHALNAGRLFHGDDALVPCTPLGCLRLIKSTLSDLTGAHAVVIGSSNIVGKPMAALLLQEHATVTQNSYPHPRHQQDLPRGRHPGERGGQGRPRARRLDQAAGHRHRRRHHARREAGRRLCGVRRRLVRRGGAGRRRDHAGAARRRPDDDRLPDGEHGEGRKGEGGPAAIARDACGDMRAAGVARVSREVS
ncbi:tetrahydrofolate dehydrogenase/cyclohydrolase catalytic domain-containing protein [Bradyrhizobium sp. 13971]